MADIVMKKAEIQPLRCLIVDDELIAIKDISSNIEQINFLIVEDTCSSAIEAAEILKEVILILCSLILICLISQVLSFWNH